MSVGFTGRATHPWEPTTVLRGDVSALRALVRGVGSVAVLTGAGISTDSGIPDYRGPSAVRATPMLISEFVASPEERRRYWARNYQGYAHLSTLRPNAGHLALARWEAAGVPCEVLGVITQNVDGLHEAAGSRRVVPLHGRAAEVVCLDCGARVSRAALQTRLAALNPDVVVNPRPLHAELRPDSDAEVSDWRDFVVAPCEVCGGILKPDVVFFGDAVPRSRVEEAFDLVERADALLVAGSSLTVMSGLRFARRAAKLAKPIAIVNHGATRADDLATIRIDAGTSGVLSALVG